MKTNQLQKNIPTGWKETKIIEIADPNIMWSFTGGPFGSNLKQDSYTESGVRIIQLQNIGDGKFLDNYKIYTSEEKAKELLSCNIYPGEIILSKMGDPVARACIIPNISDKYLMASDGIRLSVNKEKYNNYYVFLAINSGYFRKLAERSSTGSTRKRIGLVDLKKLRLLTPNLLEQNRIVQVLETWDKYLEKLDQKTKIKKKNKKGLMQNLLTGKVKLGVSDKKWQLIKIGDIGEIITGNTPPMNNIDNYEGQYCWATAEDFNGKYIFDTKIKLSEKGKNVSRFLPKGSILVTCIASIGKNAIAGIPLATNQQINSIIVNNKNNSEFIYYIIQNSNNLLKKYAGTGGIPILNKITFSNIKIHIPCNIEEQTAIANILMTADREIDELEKQRKIIMEQKKYLLNNLLTGQIRLPEFIKN